MIPVVTNRRSCPSKLRWSLNWCEFQDEHSEVLQTAVVDLKTPRAQNTSLECQRCEQSEFGESDSHNSRAEELAQNLAVTTANSCESVEGTLTPQILTMVRSSEILFAIASQTHRLIQILMGKAAEF